MGYLMNSFTKQLDFSLVTGEKTRFTVITINPFSRKLGR